MSHLKNSAALQIPLVDRLLAAWRTRKLASRGQTRSLELAETLHLGGRRQLMLVRCGKQYYLVGGGPEQIQSIVSVAAHDIAGGCPE